MTLPNTHISPLQTYYQPTEKLPTINQPKIIRISRAPSTNTSAQSVHTCIYDYDERIYPSRSPIQRLIITRKKEPSKAQASANSTLSTLSSQNAKGKMSITDHVKPLSCGALVGISTELEISREHVKDTMLERIHASHPCTNPHLPHRGCIFNNDTSTLEHILQGFHYTFKARFGSFLLHETCNGDVGAAAAVE